MMVGSGCASQIGGSDRRAARHLDVADAGQPLEASVTCVSALTEGCGWTLRPAITDAAGSCGSSSSVFTSPILMPLKTHLAADAEAGHRIFEDHRQRARPYLSLAAAREPVDEDEAEREHDEREGADQGCVGLSFHAPYPKAARARWPQK